MAKPERSSSRRTFSFENLEAKSSPSSILLDAIGTTPAPVAEVTRTAYVASDNAFLQHIALLRSVSIERAVPTQVQADAVDEMLQTSSPPFQSRGRG